jgi:hypothetical protein
VKDYTVMHIPKEQTYEWLLKKHYAHRIPSISYAFGLYDLDVLIGVCTFGKPPSNALCIGLLGEQYSKLVYELNRLCVKDGVLPNTLSHFVSQCCKSLPTPLALVSYADTSKNHIGYIYQATNWIYTGLSAKRTERYDPNNPNKHSKTVTENKRIKYQDLSVRNRPQKHRYIMFLGSKKQKKEMLACLKYPQQPYPKGDNKNYDASYEPNIQGLLL